MNSVAVFKWAMNPHDERVGSDGQIKWFAERPEAGDDDYAAVQVAHDAAPEAELVGLTMASGDMAFAAARGAARTVAI
jgi:electron transfer flavoprotein beta subunit